MNPCMPVSAYRRQHSHYISFRHHCPIQDNVVSALIAIGRIYNSRRWIHCSPIFTRIKRKSRTWNSWALKHHFCISRKTDYYSCRRSGSLNPRHILLRLQVTCLPCAKSGTIREAYQQSKVSSLSKSEYENPPLSSKMETPDGPSQYNSAVCAGKELEYEVSAERICRL